MRFHQLLDRYARARDQRAVHDRQQRWVDREVGEGGIGGLRKLDGSDGIADEEHGCPMNTGESEL